MWILSYPLNTPYYETTSKKSKASYKSTNPPSINPSMTQRAQPSRVPVHSTKRRRGILTRLMAPLRRSPRMHTTSHPVRTAPVRHHRRRPSIGDKISGAMMRLKGTLTNRSGQKVCRSLPIYDLILTEYLGCWNKTNERNRWQGIQAYSVFCLYHYY